MRLFLVMVVCCFVLMTALGFGHSSSEKQSCSVAQTHFVCPKGFKSISVDDKRIALFSKKKYGLGLFVAAPESGFDEGKFMSDLTKTTLAKIFPKESQTYSWKPINFSDRVSKFEVGGGMVQGFNGKLSVLIKYRHLKFSGQELIVGYAAEFGRGSDAKESFERGLGGDSMPGCNAIVEIVYSITSEKIDESNPPCELIVSLP